MAKDIFNQIENLIQDTDIENSQFDILDEDTAVLYFDSMYDFNEKILTREQFDKMEEEIEHVDEYIFTPMVEYWVDQDEWKYVLMYDYDTVKWDISNDLIDKIQKRVLEELSKYGYSQKFNQYISI